MSQGYLSIGLQAASSMFDAVSQSNALRGEAAAYKDNAQQDYLQGALDEADIRRRGRAVQGEAIAASAEGGGDVSGQSVQDLIYQNSLEIEYSAMSAKYNAAQAARGELFKAQQAKTAARNAIIGGIMGAGAAAVTGMGRQQDYQARYNAYFPGGQRLPMPPTVPRSYTGTNRMPG